MIKLGKNERLVSAGTANLQTPSGELIQGVQQYRIVSAQEANPEDVVTLQQNERLVYAGQVCDKKRAEDRFEWTIVKKVDREKFKFVKAV